MPFEEIWMGTEGIKLNESDLKNQMLYMWNMDIYNMDMWNTENIN